jgi:hypothetical protein
MEGHGLFTNEEVSIVINWREPELDDLIDQDSFILWQINI